MLCLQTVTRSKLLRFTLEQSKILFDLRAQILAIKSDRRVITDQKLPPLVHDDAPARLRHALDAEHLLRRHAAQQHHKLWIEQLDLLEEIITRAGLNFEPLRRAILRRATLDRVGDEEIVAIKPRPFEHVIEVASGRADEWMARLILLFTRRFADDHD